MYRLKVTLSSLVLGLANLVPLIGVLFYGWDASSLIYLYWIENAIVGAFTIAKLALVRPGTREGHAGKLFMIPFFCVHYSIFMTVHVMFLQSLFPLPAGLTGIIPQEIGFGFLLPSLIARILRGPPPLAHTTMMWVIVGLIASHAVSFVQNFILGREFTERTLPKVMFEPYPRIVFLHVVILASAFLSMRMRSPTWLLYVIVVLKLTIDLVMHVRSHGFLQRTGGSRPHTP